LTAANEKQIPQEELFAELAHLIDQSDRRDFVARHPDLVRPDVVTRLAEVVVRRIRVDASESLRLAEAAVEIAQLLKSNESLAFGLRAKGNAVYALGEIGRASCRERV
jgi:hypothetical protein